MSNSLRFRLILIFIGLTLGPWIVGGTIIGFYGTAAIEEQTLNVQRELATRVGTEVRAFIEGREDELIHLDYMFSMETRDLETQRAALNSELLHQQNFQQIVLLDSSGMETIRLSRDAVILDSALQSRADRDEFLIPITTRESYFGPVYFDEHTQEPLMIIAVPVIDHRTNDVVSVVLADLRVKVIWDLLASIALPYDGSIYILDEAGKVIAHDNSSVVLRGTTIDALQEDGRAQGLLGGEVVIASHSLQIGGQEFFIVAEQPLANALEVAVRTSTISTGIMLIAFIFAAALTLLTTKRIVEPIKALAASTQALQAGDFSQRVTITSRDEVGQLASAFNQMTADLEKSNATIAQYTLELELKNNELQNDIAKRTEIEQALRASEDKFRSLAESSQDYIMRYDHACRVIYANPAALNLIGLNEKDILGKTFREAGFDGKSSILWEQEIQHVFEIGQSVQTVLNWENPEGQVFLDLRLSPEFDVSAKIKTVLGISRDVTDIMQAEQALQQYSRQLETLQAVTAALSTTLSLDDLLDLVLKQTKVVLPYDSATIFLIEDEALTIAKVQGISQNFVGRTYPLNDGFVQDVQQSHQPVMLSDALQDSRFQDWGNVNLVRGWMGIPLIVRNEMIGFLTLDSHQADTYQPEHAVLAQSFANQAAQAIDNARLFEQTKAHAFHLEARVASRTEILETIAMNMAGREIRMAELKKVIKKLRTQIEEAGIEPVANDPLLEPWSSKNIDYE